MQSCEGKSTSKLVIAAGYTFSASGTRINARQPCVDGKIVQTCDGNFRTGRAVATRATLYSRNRNYFNGHLMNDFFYFSLWAVTELVCDDSALTRLRKRVTILVRTTDLEISDRAQSHGFFSPAV